MPTNAIATAADYADALVTARRAKHLLALLLVLMLLIQLGLFFVARYTNLIPAADALVPAASTQPAPQSIDQLHYLTGISIFLGLTLTIVLSFVLLLILNIMLVGRLIGAGRLAGAYILCLVLLVLLFPWQAFLRDVTMTSREFIIPGVLYTWDELRLSAHFPTSDWRLAALKWARFVGFPAVALVVLLMIQAKSNRGLRQALGEEDIVAEPSVAAEGRYRQHA